MDLPHFLAYLIAFLPLILALTGILLLSQKCIRYPQPSGSPRTYHVREVNTSYTWDTSRLDSISAGIPFYFSTRPSPSVHSTVLWPSKPILERTQSPVQSLPLPTFDTVIANENRYPVVIQAPNLPSDPSYLPTYLESLKIEQDSTTVSPLHTQHDHI